MFKRSSWQSTEQERLERYKKQKLFSLKNKIIYSGKIDYYIPANWDFPRRKVHDYIIYLNSSLALYKTKESALESALRLSSEPLEGLQNSKQGATYIARDLVDKAAIIIFYGNEEKSYERVLERKASFEKGIPQVIEGRVCGKIAKADILKVMFKYDREYALYLRKLYDAQFTGKYINKY